MTDPARFQAHWKTPFFFSPSDKPTPNDIHQYVPSPLLTNPSLSAHSLPTSPNHHHHLHQTNSCVSFQPFDPFDIDSTLDDLTAISNKDAELDKLSTLLSRQFLQDVDAETIPSSTTTTKTTCSSAATTTPNTRMLSSFTHTVSSSSSPWTLDEGSAVFNQPWSPALSSNGLLPSPPPPPPTTTVKDTNHHSNRMATDNTSTAIRWDRFEPYGNDSEFDPTLPLYNGHPSPNHNNTFGISNNMGGYEENANTMTVALRKLALLFPHMDEKQLEQTLATLEYDVERTIEVLSPKSLSSTTTTQSIIPPSSSSNLVTLTTPSISKPPTTTTSTPEKVHLIKSSPVNATTTTTTTNNHYMSNEHLPTGTTIRKRQVCRHYLAGECYRKDCWFAHDLEIKPCKFWLQGLCLKGDTCEFAHILEELEQHQHLFTPTSSPSLSNNDKSNHSPISHHQQQQQPNRHHHSEQQQQQQYTSPTVADFPILVARSKRKSKKKSQNKKIKK